MKVYVAYFLVKGEMVLAGLIGGFNKEDARQLFAVERRRRSTKNIVVKWTPEVSYREYLRAEHLQTAFFERTLTCKTRAA